MSFIRYGHPLRFFKDTKSNMYVYGMEDRIYGIGDINEDTNNENLIELIGKFIDRIEFDFKYENRYATYHIVQELAIRLGIEDKLRPYNEVFDEAGHWIR